MGLFDGLGENDADKRRAAVVRRQAQLLDEQIAEKQRGKRGAASSRRDEKAYLIELFERDEPASRQLSQSPSVPRVQPPPQSQIQLAPQAPSVPAQQPFHYQQQFWANQVHSQVIPNRSSGQQAFMQQLQNELLNQPVIQLPSLLSQPLQPQLPKLPALPSARVRLQSWESPLGSVGAAPRPASLPPAHPARQQPIAPELALGGELDAWKLHREAPKPLAFSALPGQTSDGLPSKQQKEKAGRANNLIDIDAEWKQWESKRNTNHPFQPPGWRGAVSPQSQRPFQVSQSVTAAAGEGSEASKATAAPFPEPILQASASASVSDSRRERSSQSMVAEGARSFPDRNPLPPSSAGWVQPPRPSASAGSDNIRAAAASNLVNDLHKVKRSWLDERDQLRSQSDALKKEVSRLRAEKVSLPSPSGRSHSFSQGPTQRQSEVPLPRPLPLATQPRVEPPTALVFSPCPLDSQPALFSPSLASIHAGVYHAGASFARSPAADALLLGSFSPSSGLPEASHFVYDLPDEPRSISTSPLKASMSESLLPQASHLLYEPPKKPKNTISTGAPKESLFVSKPASRHLSDTHQAKVEQSMPFERESQHESASGRVLDSSSLHASTPQREDLVRSIESQSKHMRAGSAGPLPSGLVHDSSSLYALSPKQKDLVQSIESKSGRASAHSAGPLPPKQQELDESFQGQSLRVSESIMVPVPPEHEEPGQSSQSQSGHVDEDSAVSLVFEQQEIVQDIEIQSDHSAENSVASLFSKLQVRVQVRIDEDSAAALPSEREEPSQNFQSQQRHLIQNSGDHMPSKPAELGHSTQRQEGESSESSALPAQSKLAEPVQSGLTQPEHVGEGLQSEASTVAAPPDMTTQNLSYVDTRVSLDRTTPEPQPAFETRPAAESIPAPASQPTLTSSTASDSRLAPQSQTAAESQLALATPEPQPAPESFPAAERSPVPASQPELSASDSQPAPQSQAAAESQTALESTLRTPHKTVDRMLSTDFLGTLQYSDSEGGETPGTSRRRPPADLNKVIDLGAEMKKTPKNDASSTASNSEDSATRQKPSAFRKSLRGTQELLISALINEDGSVGATSDPTSSPSGQKILMRPVGIGQGSTGGSSDEDQASERTIVQGVAYSSR
eukprot:TRINITY_DN9791_c0_g1_i2.p1 TRINITY_DN9791_c0_g1~~TRINITY_DN9791_c0_g1_i2.p1  ORF type:complete len:1133 (+),score=162.06 TRINITY_DN9791_c0_g1_i2:196-3594(+)